MALLFKSNYIVGCAANDFAKLFQRDHGNIVPFFQRIQRFVIDTTLEQLVLGNSVALHGFPHGLIVKDGGHLLTLHLKPL